MTSEGAGGQRFRDRANGEGAEVLESRSRAAVRGNSKTDFEVSFAGRAAWRWINRIECSNARRVSQDGTPFPVACEKNGAVSLSYYSSGFILHNR